MTTIQFQSPRVDFVTVQVDGKPASSEQIERASRMAEAHADNRATGLKPVLSDLGGMLMVIGWAESTAEAKSIGRQFISENTGEPAQSVTCVAGTDLDGLPCFVIG